ncbi:MAG: hypothetical protein ACOY9D_04855 [Pseudomonadota bacterium]
MLSKFRFRNASTSKISFIKIGIILCWLGWAVLYSLTASIDLPTMHLDGAFQTASGLYRLDAGQFPGKDFFPYLGIGPLFALYPFFKTLGANISASVFSAQLLVLLSGALSTAIIWQLIWRPKSFITSLVAGSLLFVAPIGIAYYFSIHFPPWMRFFVSPGSSLRPIRATAPYLVAIIYYLFIFHISTPRYKYIFSGLLTGSILLWSNDFAIPTAGLFAFLIFATALHCKEFQNSNILFYVVATVFSWMTLFALATHGHPIELLKYNFLDVAQDQWWYFGPYEEGKRVFSVEQLTRLLTHHNKKILFVLALTAILAYRTRLTELILLLWIGVALFFGGVVATVGGHFENDYFGGFYFWGILVTLIALFRLLWLGFKKIFPLKLSSGSSHQLAFFMVIMLVISMLLMIDSFDRYKSERNVAQADTTRFYVPELGGYLTSDWRNYIALARASKDKVVFEEYWGLWSAILRVFPEWPVDSVIHALGSKRDEAKTRLSNAELIITTREDAFSTWVGWNISQNYWFYQDLLQKWVPLAHSPLTTVWHKGSSKQFIDASCRVVSKDKFLVNAKNRGFVEVNIEFSSDNFRTLILVRNNLSYVGLDGYVSINPKNSSSLIPAFANSHGDNIYDVQVLPEYKKSSFALISCQAKELLGDLVYGKVIVEPNADLTNVNWVHGIARNWAGFLVPNRQKFADEYKVGRIVEFANGLTREITRVEPNGLYLNVYIKGDELDHKEVGSPTKFVVMDKQKVPKK